MKKIISLLLSIALVLVAGTSMACSRNVFEGNYVEADKKTVETFVNKVDSVDGGIQLDFINGMMADFSADADTEQLTGELSFSMGIKGETMETLEMGGNAKAKINYKITDPDAENVNAEANAYYKDGYIYLDLVDKTGKNPDEKIKYPIDFQAMEEILKILIDSQKKPDTGATTPETTPDAQENNIIKLAEILALADTLKEGIPGCKVNFYTEETKNFNKLKIEFIADNNSEKNNSTNVDAGSDNNNVVEKPEEVVKVVSTTIFVFNKEYKLASFLTEANINIDTATVTNNVNYKFTLKAWDGSIKAPTNLKDYTEDNLNMPV